MYFFPYAALLAQFSPPLPLLNNDIIKCECAEVASQINALCKLFTEGRCAEQCRYCLSWPTLSESLQCSSKAIATQIEPSFPSWMVCLLLCFYRHHNSIAFKLIYHRDDRLCKCGTVLKISTEFFILIKSLFFQTFL